MTIVGIHYANQVMLRLQRKAVREVYGKELLVASGGEYIRPNIRVNPSKTLSGSHRYCDMVNQALHKVPFGDLLILEADIIPIEHYDFRWVTWRNYLGRPYPGILYRPDGIDLTDSPHLTKPFRGGEIDSSWVLMPWRWETGEAPSDTHIGRAEIVGEAFRHFNGQDRVVATEAKPKPKIAECKQCEEDCIIASLLTYKPCEAKRLAKKVEAGLLPCNGTKKLSKE